jgi:hypothetical protein
VVFVVGWAGSAGDSVAIRGGDNDRIVLALAAQQFEQGKGVYQVLDHVGTDKESFAIVLVL